MGIILFTAISKFLQLLSMIVFVDVILSYFLPPYNPIRAFLDRIVEPLLSPIRRVVPAMAGIDFSPMVLIILLQVLDSVISSVAVRF
ncbi:MAG: YggT family protein [Leptolinea sp.]